MVVGLTGGIGSGKTTVLNQFKKFENVAVYIADVEAKLLMNTSKEIKSNLVSVFGKEVYKNNELNRSYLANIVFKDTQKLSQLNKIVHPVVAKHFQVFCAENKKKAYIVYENAILFENGNDKNCDKIITVTAPLHVRIKRVMSRDNVTKEEVELRIKNQWADEKKILQSNYIIENIELKDTLLKVLEIHNNLTKLQSLSK